MAPGLNPVIWLSARREFLRNLSDCVNGQTLVTEPDAITVEILAGGGQNPRVLSQQGQTVRDVACRAAELLL